MKSKETLSYNIHREQGKGYVAARDKAKDRAAQRLENKKKREKDLGREAEEDLETL